MSTYFGLEVRETTSGVLRKDIGYKHIRVLWNGHTEFWTEVDDNFFRLDGDAPAGRPLKHRFLYPYAISEPVENFILFVNEVCRLANFGSSPNSGGVDEPAAVPFYLVVL